MRRHRDARYAPEALESKLRPSGDTSGVSLWNPAWPDHQQEWTCLPKSSRLASPPLGRPDPIPAIEVELSGGPYDGARFRVPADTLVIDVPSTAFGRLDASSPEGTAFVRVKHTSYKETGRLTPGGASVFTFAG